MFKAPTLPFFSENDVIVLSEIPIPPSSNSQYIPVSCKGKMRFIPSTELKDFKKAMVGYSYAFKLHSARWKEIALRWKNEGRILGIDAHFAFNRSRIYTLKGVPKRFDVSNRLKALHDCVSEMVGIDDSMFFDIFARKREVVPGEREGVTVTIFPYF